MNKNRVESIKMMLEGTGTIKGMEYTGQEQIDLLKELQRKQLNLIYEKVHADFMREQDLVRHIRCLVDEYGLTQSATYQRYEKNMDALSYEIASFIKGMQGERIARRALKLLTYDKNVKILYNIALEDEDAKAEYDAIVITSYGLFVVEVKNWASEMVIDENGMLVRYDKCIKYDLPGRMNIKESLLRAYLGDKFPNKYDGIVLFSNDNAKVEDNYRGVKLSFGGGIVNQIRMYNDGKDILSESDIEEIADILKRNHKEQKGECRIDCEAIIEDFAVILSAIEDAAAGRSESVDELLDDNDENIVNDDKSIDYKTIDIADKQITEETLDEQQLKKITMYATGLIALTGLGIIAINKLSGKR